MARGDVSNIGIAPVMATYAIDDSTITYSSSEINGSASVGLAVTLSAGDTVALAGDGEAVIGKLIKVEADNKATVQIGGVVTLPGGDGASLTEGSRIVGDLDASSNKGYIRDANSATAAELVVCAHQIHNTDTATAVVVYLS